MRIATHEAFIPPEADRFLLREAVPERFRGRDLQALDRPAARRRSRFVHYPFSESTVLLFDTVWKCVR
jgi:hypothetical protein